MENERKLETYANLCTEYYELDKPCAPRESFELFLSYAKEAKGPILEPMCGTGRFLIPLIEAGHTVDGFDASPHMLSKLHQKCITKNLKPYITECFLQDMNLGKQYGVIYITCGSFNLITDLEQAKAALKKIWEHLLPGGLFVCEFETLNFVSTNFGSRTVSSKSFPDGRKIVFTIIPRPFENNIDSLICHYELFNADQLLQSETELFQVRLYEHEHLQALLHEAGFSKVNVLKAFDRNSSPDPKDNTVIYECMK